MLVIRMRRMGSTKRPMFRIVVADASAPRDGRFIEVLGHYQPRTVPERVVIDRERLAYWLAKGARPSDTVKSLVARLAPASAAGEAPASAS